MKFRKGQTVYNESTHSTGIVIECYDKECIVELLPGYDEDDETNKDNVVSFNVKDTTIARYYILDRIVEDIADGSSDWEYFAKILILNNFSLNDLIKTKKELIARDIQNYLRLDEENDFDDIFDIAILWDSVRDIKEKEIHLTCC